MPDLAARLATLIRYRAAHNATADELGLLGELAATLPQAVPAPSRRLTPQQARLLPLLLEGRSMKLCGKALDISPDTVKDHAVQVYRKYGVRSRYALMTRFGRLPAPEVHP